MSRMFITVPTGGGGGGTSAALVTSVNGETGDVVLTANEIMLATSAPVLGSVQEVLEQLETVAKYFDRWNAPFATPLEVKEGDSINLFETVFNNAATVYENETQSKIGFMLSGANKVGIIRDNVSAIANGKLPSISNLPYHKITLQVRLDFAFDSDPRGGSTLNFYTKTPAYADIIRTDFLVKDQLRDLENITIDIATYDFEGGVYFTDGLYIELENNTDKDLEISNITIIIQVD